LNGLIEALLANTEVHRLLHMASRIDMTYQRWCGDKTVRSANNVKLSHNMDSDATAEPVRHHLNLMPTTYMGECL